MLETKAPAAEATREAERKAERGWRDDWRSNTGNCRAKFKDVDAYLAHRRQSFTRKIVTGTRQHRGA